MSCFHEQKVYEQETGAAQRDAVQVLRHNEVKLKYKSR
jgi:hypothetical protein